MAKAKSEGTLADFSFDNDSLPFFGIKTGEGDIEQQEEVLDKVKGKNIKKLGATIDDDDDDDNDDKGTKIDDEEGEVEEVDDDISFGSFGEEEDEKPKPQVKKPETKKDEKPASQKEETEEEDTETQGSEKETEEESETGDEKVYGQLALELKERKLFKHVEIKEGTEIPEDKFFELFEQELEASLEEEREALVEDMGDEGRDFVRFVKAGGNPKVFFKNYNSSGYDISEFDEKNPAHLDTALRHYLSTKEGLDESEIADRIEFLETKGKKALKAKEYHDKIVEEEKKKNELIIKAQEAAREKKIEDSKAFNKQVKEVLATLEEWKGFTFSAKERKELSKFMLEPSVKVGKNTYLTELQSEVSKIFSAGDEEALKDFLLLSKLIKGKFKIEDIAPEIKDRVVKKAQSKIAQIKKSVGSGSTGFAAGKKTLADRFS